MEEHLDWTDKLSHYKNGTYYRIYPEKIKNYIPNCIKCADSSFYPVLLENSSEYNEESANIKWEDKKPIAVFRGSSTGCGVTINTNQRLKAVSSVIIALTTNIKKYKEKKAKEEAAEKAKKDEEARMAEAEAKLEIAKKAKGDALEAKKREKAAKKEAKAAAKKEAKVEKAKNAKEEGLKKQARQARLVAEAETVVAVPVAIK
jgi:hypothetical protein